MKQVTGRRGAAALATTAVLALAACGGSDEQKATTTAGEDTAKTQAVASIEAAKKLPEFTLEAPTIDLEKVRGKKIFNIPLTSAIPYVVAISKEGEKIAKEHGVEWVEHTNQGTPTEYAAGINQAIQQKADVIILSQGIDPQLVIPALRDAKRAGIPVLAAHNYQNGEQAPESVRDLLGGLANAPFAEAAALEVDFAVAQDGCDIKPLAINGADIPPSKVMQKAIEERLAELCPDVKLETLDVTVPEWGTKIRPEVQSRLTQDPKINWIFAHYDSMGIPAEAGIRAAGRIGDVKVVGFNGTPAVLKMLQDGKVIAGDVGENVNWLAYSAVDQAFRMLGAGPVIESGDVGSPVRVFDKSNVDDAGTPPTMHDGYGDAYVDGYRKLWGLEAR